MKKIAFLLVLLLILSVGMETFADSSKKTTIKAKNISSVEIDGNKLVATTFSLVEIREYEPELVVPIFVLSGKGAEGVEICIYAKKDRKEQFSQQGLVEKFKIGKSGYFAKKIDVGEGSTYILIVATKDKDVQMNLLRVFYEKKESIFTKIEKVISNFINSLGK